MDLSRQILKDFADVTRGVESEKTQYLRGTIKSHGETKYVRIDGSESLTPISEIVDVKEGDRVLVTIENHEATILGNLTKPPSAYKEEDAIDKAENAQGTANDAKNLAQSAGIKADAALEDAKNASTSANEAKENAQEAIESANIASEKAEEAKDLATSAGQNAQTAVEEAASAQNAASAAQGEVTRIQGVVNDVKGDIDTALQEVADQAADLQATKETMELNYAKKTEVSEIEASLTTEISKKVGELQTTVSETYAAKNDVVDLEGRLQSQITQTAGEVSSVVGKVEKLESDTTEAQQKVDEALAKSATANAAAEQAQADATAAQTAADVAKENAHNAAIKADEAVQNAATAAATAAEADKKVSAAKTDLAEAKENLANTINRVGATEQEIAAAQQKVDAAQAAVTQAQKDAAEATAAANTAQDAANKAQTDATEAQNAATNAQKKADTAVIAASNAQAAADKAQQDVAALTKRVTVAETSITQNAEQIKLAATKTEEIGNKIDNLSIGSDNLIINGGFPVDTHGWTKTNNVEFYPHKHIYYFNGNKTIFCATSIVPGEGFLKTNRFKVKKNTTYALSFVGFAGANVRSTDVTFLGRKNSDVSDYTIIKNIFLNLNLSQSASTFYKATFSTGDSDEGYIRFDHNGSTDGQVASMFFGEVMLVEGTVAKKYQPSSADTQSQIDGVNNNLTNNYYSKTQTDAAINVAADSITTTVRQEVTTEITNVNNKVDNLQIGGRNILRGTKEMKLGGSSSNWTDGTWRQSNTGTTKNVKLTDFPLANITQGIEITSDSTRCGIAQDRLKMESGDYTLSYYVKAKAPNTVVRIQAFWNSNAETGDIYKNITLTDTNWTRVSITSDLKVNQDAVSAGYIYVETPNSTITVAAPFEHRSNKEAEWSPAPEDQQSQIDGINNNLQNNYFTKEQTEAAITVKADSITQTVSSTYATKNNTIKSSVEEFYQSTSPTSLSGGSWSTTQPTWTQGKYIWRRTKNTYGNDSVDYTPSVNGVCITGNTGATGANGQNGKGVSSYSVTYQVGTSGTTAPTGTWTTTIPTVPQGQYLWTKMVITYTDGTSSTSYSVSYIPTNGQNGATGATGNGVSSIITEFYLSTSKTTQTGGSWSTTQPTWSPGKYVWTRNKITYTNGSTAYTTPQCSSEWEAVNDIQVGGRNLYSQTKSKIYSALRSTNFTKTPDNYGFVCTFKNLSLEAVRLEKLSFDGITFATVSFDAYVNTNELHLNVDICDRGKHGFNITTSKKRYVNYVSNIDYFNIADGQGYYNGFVDFEFTLASGQELHIENIMIEHATTNSAWSPAPEEMATAEDMTNLTQTVTKQSTKIDQTSSKIDLVASSVTEVGNNLSNNYYSKTQTDAAIKLASDSVTTTVRNEITTVNNKVDSLSIGSDNLIINGGFPTDTHGWDKKGIGVFEVRLHSFYFNGKKNMFCIINNNRLAGYEGKEECIVYSNYFNVKPNTDYTLSFVGFSSSNVASTEVHYLGKLNKDDGSYSNITTLFNKMSMPPIHCQYYQYTFNSGNSNVGTIRFDNNGSTDGNESLMYFSEVMLVEGTVAKKYQPSSEDMATLTQYTEVKQLADRISSTVYDSSSGLVTKTEQLAGSYAIQNINSYGDVLSSLNMNGDNVHIKGSLIELDGNVTMQDAFIANLTSNTILTDKIEAQAATIVDAKITNLDATNITSGYIDTERIKVNDLSTLSANLGIITAGIIKNASGSYVNNVTNGTISSKSGDRSIYISSGDLTMKRNGKTVEMDANGLVVKDINYSARIQPQVIEVNGAIYASDYFRNANDYVPFKNIVQSDGDSTTKVKQLLRLGGSSNPYLHIGTSKGNYGVTLWTSDEKLKENIYRTNDDEVAEKINKVNVYSFDWKADGTHTDYGFIAQDIQKTFPQSVYDVDGTLNINVSGIVPPMLSAIKVLSKRVDILRDENQLLRKRVDILQGETQLLKARLESM